MAFLESLRGVRSVPPSAIAQQPIVYVVDDDASLREALVSLFRSVDLKVKAFNSAKEFLEDDRAEAPGCLVLDVRLPGINGLDFQDQLAERGVELPVVLMTGHGDIPMTVRGMKAGAVDFLPKPFRDQDMLDAVTTAIERHRQIRSEGDARKTLQDRYDTLSAREKQVMSLVAAGRLNKQAAGDLGISEITVKIHRGSAMRKMGARTLPDLVRMAEKLKMSVPKAN